MKLLALIEKLQEIHQSLKPLGLDNTEVALLDENGNIIDIGSPDGGADVVWNVLSQTTLILVEVGDPE
jgi:hypothetical protein